MEKRSKKVNIPAPPLIRLEGGALYIRHRKFRLLAIAAIGLVLYFIYFSFKGTNEAEKLASQGKISKGEVTARYLVGSKGTIRIDYTFTVNNVLYEGHTSNEEYLKGAAIYILYLEKDPTINASYSFIKRNFKTSISPP